MGKAPAAKHISQSTFDEAVHDNIETFEMEPDEAVREAITEFELAGVTLEGIIKDYAGEAGRAEHPVIAAVQQLEAALACEDEAAEAQVLVKLAALDVQLGEAAVEGAAEKAGANGAVEAVLAACTPGAVQVAALRTLLPLLSHPQNRIFFYGRGGPKLMCSILDEQCTHAPAVAGAAAAAAAAATKSEPNKAELMKLEVGLKLVAVLREHPTDAAVVEAACATVRSICTPDDPHEPASGAFRNAQTLSKQGVADALLEAVGAVHLQATTTAQAEADAVQLTLAGTLCTALKHVAANEEVCKQVAESGGVEDIMQLVRGAGAKATAVARPACALLRQLAGSDTLKPHIISADGLGVARRILEVHAAGQREATKGAAAATVEQSLGLLTALCLRYPDGAAAAAEAGCLQAAMEVRLHCIECDLVPGFLAVMAGLPLHAGVQRQACMFLRNTVVRNEENKPKLLDNGVEALLRAAKRNHPKTCMDVSSAALRDLGCDNYNEGWNPTTVIMGADGVMRTPEELDDEVPGEM